MPRSVKSDKTFSSMKHMVVKPELGNNLLVEDNPHIESLDCRNMASQPKINISSVPNLETIILDSNIRRRRSKYAVQKQRIQTARLNFHTTPNSSIRVNGRVSEISVFHEGTKINSGVKPDGDFITRLEPAQNAIICRDPDEAISENNCEFVVLILHKESQVKTIEIGENFPRRHISVIGPSNCAKLIIHAPLGSERIVVNNMPNLTNIELRGSTKILEITNCRALRAVHGFGTHLLFNYSGSSAMVNIGGLWLNVPERATSRTSLMNEENMRTCNDLEFIKILPHNYLTLCDWCEKFNLATNDVIDGISIPVLISGILSQPVGVFECLRTWFEQSLTLQHQYQAMRILLALGLSGFPPKILWEMRGIVLKNNIASGRMSARMTETLDFTGLGIYANIMNDKAYNSTENEKLPVGAKWVTPTDSYVPFHRLDLELWLLCNDLIDKDVSYPKPNELMNNSPKHGFPSKITSPMLVFPPKITSMINGTLSIVMVNAVMDARRIPRENESTDFLLEQLFEAILNSLKNSDDGPLFDIVIQELIFNSNSSQITGIVSTIMESDIVNWMKAALLMGIASYSSDIKIKMGLMKLMSQSEILREEARDINKVATCGSRAFDKKGVARLEWPFIDSWSDRYGR